MASDEHHRAGQFAVLRRFGEEFEPGHVRQAVIQQHAIRRLATQQSEPCHALGRQQQLAIEQVLPVQQLDVTTAIDLVVLDNQQAVA